MFFFVKFVTDFKLSKARLVTPLKIHVGYITQTFLFFLQFLRLSHCKLFLKENTTKQQLKEAKGEKSFAFEHIIMFNS